MADTKVSALTADTSPTTDDLVMTVNDPGGTPGSRKITLDNVLTALKVSRLLGYTQYNGSNIDKTTTSSSDSDADSTNLTVTFTVPASGNVLVSLCADAYQTGANTYTWCVRDTGGSTISGTSAIIQGASFIEQRSIHRVVITGLTPGTSTTYRWGFAVTGGTAHLRAGTSYGAAVMEVYSIP